MRISLLEQTNYSSASAVVSSEAIKLIVSILVVLIYRINQPLITPDCWKLGIPALLYLVQNNLQYYASQRMDVASFSLTYQLKIPCTAAFSVMLLKKHLSWRQISGLVVLVIGVSLIQYPSENKSSGKETSLQGLAAVLIACIISGLSGVWFEMVLKTSNVNLWIRNTQLSFFSLLIGSAALFFDNQVFARGLFAGYNYYTVITILLQSFGGLIVAVVVKYADNILKGFVTTNEVDLQPV